MTTRMSLTRRHLLGTSLALPLALSIGAIGSARADAKRIRFSYQRSSTLLTILKKNQTFEKKLGALGLDVTWDLFSSVIEPMNEGSVDFHADVADAVPIFTQAAGAKLTIYAKEDPSPSAEAIIVHEDSPIRSVADLKGKKIGVSKGSGAHFLLVSALKNAGLGVNDVTTAFLPAPEGFAAFQGRSIDAWSIWDPFLAITQSKTPVRVLQDGKGISSYYRYYLVNDDIVTTRPDIVRIVFDSLVETGQWLKSNPDDAAQLLAPIWGDIPFETVKVVNSRRSCVVKPVERSALGEQQKIADTFFDAGLIPKKIIATDARIWHPDTGRS